MCLPTALALPLHSTGTSAPPIFGSSARCYKKSVRIKSPHRAADRGKFCNAPEPLRKKLILRSILVVIVLLLPR
jgi:hypothetical protein